MRGPPHVASPTVRIGATDLVKEADGPEILGQVEADGLTLPEIICRPSPWPRASLIMSRRLQQPGADGELLDQFLARGPARPRGPCDPGHPDCTRSSISFRRRGSASGRSNGCFVTRAIDVVIALGTGISGKARATASTLSGYWVRCDITKGGAPSFDKAECRIFGPSRDLMNQLTRLGKPIAYERVNTVTINAGDAQSGMSQVFTGLIQTIYGTTSPATPNACLVISAFGSTNTLNAAKPGPEAAMLVPPSRPQSPRS